MSGPFVYHHFKIVTTKRRSKCKASDCVDFAEQGYIEAGEECLQLTTGSIRSERNARYCMKCAMGTIQHFKDPFDAIVFKLESHKGIREVEDYRPEPRTKDYVNNTLLTDDIDEDDIPFSADDIPF